MVRVFNREGHTDSPYLRIINQGYPADIDTPIELLSKTNTSVSVQLPLVTDFVVSYSLEIDSGQGSDFRVVSEEKTMETQYTIENLEEGSVYRLRYRVLNLVGWSTYSPTLHVLVATVPAAPQRAP